MKQMLNEVIPSMNQNQKAHLEIAIFDQLPSDIVEALLVQQLSSMPKTRLQSVMNSLPDEVRNRATFLVLKCLNDGLMMTYFKISDSKHSCTRPVPKNKR